MTWRFSGEIVTWRGPAPFYFVAVPVEEADELRDLAAEASYGWGVIPVSVRIGQTKWTTTLFPKDGGYLVPIKLAVRRAEDLDDGALVTLDLAIAWPT